MRPDCAVLRPFFPHLKRVREGGATLFKRQWRGERWTDGARLQVWDREEYFLVDAETKSVSREMPKSFLEQVSSATAGQAMGEMLQSQIRGRNPPTRQYRGSAHGIEISAPDGRQYRRRSWARHSGSRHASHGDLAQRRADAG